MGQSVPVPHFHRVQRLPVDRPMISPGMNRLLSLVFAAAVLPLLGLYGILIKAALPTPTGGMETTVATVCVIAFTVIFAALITVSLNFSRQLSRQAKGDLTTP